MKKLYLIGSVIVFLFILIMALPQIAATCVWYTPIGGTANPAFVVFQASGLGMVLGGFLTLFWKYKDEGAAGNDEESEK